MLHEVDAITTQILAAIQKSQADGAAGTLPAAAASLPLPCRSSRRGVARRVAGRARAHVQAQGIRA